MSIESSLQPFQKYGVQFLYPDIWELEETADDNNVIVTVSSEGTCFWAIHILGDCPPPPQAVESCIEAFMEEYEDAEASVANARLADMPAYARDLNFSCYELMNTASLQSVRTTDFTLLVLWQGTDHELSEYRHILEFMTSSVRAESLIDEEPDAN
jgi:hypothetical protein